MNRDQLRDRILTMVPEDEAERIMGWVDTYAADLMEEPPEAWTATQIAEFIGAKSKAQARTWCSRNGIKSIAFQDHPVSGRQQALYPADQVRDTYFKKSMKETMR